MREDGYSPRRFARFWSAFVLAVAAAVITVLVVAQVWALAIPPRQWVWEEYPLGVFVIVAIIASLFGFIPAALAFRKNLGLVSCSTLGSLTGLFAILAVIVFSTDLDPTSVWMWRDVSQKVGYLPVFSLAGFIGGAVFGWVSHALSHD